MSESETKCTPKPITPAECEICSKLAEVQTSFYKYGWDDMDQPLPDEARRLVPVEPITSENEHRHVKQCPICGTLYRYQSWHEYYINGTEDYEELVRLSAAEQGLND